MIYTKAITQAKLRNKYCQGISDKVVTSTKNQVLCL